MRKVCAAILSAAICLAVSGAPAWASEQQATLSAGYLHARTNAPGSENLNGINVKYRYEFTDTLGLITSFSYANAEDEQKTHYSDTRWHEDSVRNRWFSVMAGPSVRVNEWFSAYAMAGTHSLSGSTNAAGNHSHRDGRRFNPSVFKDTYQYGYTSSGQNTWGVQGSVGMSTGWLANTSTDGNHSHSLSGTAASAGAHAHTVGIGAHTHSVAIGSHGHTITVNAAGNAENTVKNIAFNYIVRLA
ncbi:Ail/Lom family outer membrane beta-barrel protein [Escherichia coli]|uniref:Ail/Lom family outer membrane beta-barrel protein n=12 Tax=Enterobacteriaceae TaxID=543 RepID=UPI001079EB00|nr:Ail/Lom family outer membrane beta-barrel protein [Escherichia coli]EAC1891663.1 hypothetical protein [Escherichia coli]EFH6273280.1 Ail/Lom family outer membrane beta-barrel protein [Escherichia coli]EHC2022113.1 Ail/Lom family outer membrane beta-barrel protein [Escherichia coli]EKL6584515.1 Ail/Lom family outer membrane beta-barrel protein [Escherichia coli]MBW9395278.1 Ail/Lom family outer membrane beta-barrel protein [Escherichia coli]